MNDHCSGSTLYAQKHEKFMIALEIFLPTGILGISYLYWAILTFFIALVTFFIRIPPFAMPRNPSNWILKKYILQYFHGVAWLLISWVLFRIYRKDGEFTWWLGILTGLALIMLITFFVVWAFDRYKIRQMKEQKRNSNT